MATDLGAMSWMSPGDYALSPQSQVSVTDLSQHVTGGTSTRGTAASSNASVSQPAKKVLYIAAAYVGIAVILLVVLGGLVFKTATQ